MLHFLKKIPLANILIGATIFLSLTGLALSFSTTVVEGAKGGATFGRVSKEALFLLVGAAVFYCCKRIPIEKRFIYSSVLLIGSVGAMLFALLFSAEQYGARRWLDLGFVSLQPSEFARVFLSVWVAVWISKHKNLFVQRHYFVMIPVFISVGVAAVAFLSPDLEGSMLIGLSGIAPVVVAGLPYIATMIMGGGLLAILLVDTFLGGKAYRLERVTNWRQFNDTEITSQIVQGVFAIHRGGYFGVGPSHGQSQWGRLPNLDSDFVFAVLGEEYGFLGMFLVILAYTTIIIVGMVIFRNHPTTYGRFCAFGLVFSLGLQVFINIASVVRVLPVTGLNLPLLSTGGSSKLSTFIALGILLRLASQTDKLLHGDEDELESDRGAKLKVVATNTGEI